MKHLPEHPNIVTLKATYEDDKAVNLVMELCEGGELFDRIVARGHYTERAAAGVFRTIVEVIIITTRRQQGQGGRSSEREDERKGTPRYQKVTARLRHGVVVVVPAGHPFVTVASDDQNLEMLCFEINTNNNQKFSLAGKSNVVSQLERDAKELAFGAPAKEVDEVFQSQEGDFFFKVPIQRRQREGRADE